ncbi:peptide chain release factor N(5)-glutamine methyltransferase [Marivita sp. XM-24bin2]|jgi:release factor glutamine methyltransferase|uniref:peptide chain release factor N(5)-glutamine methyltransferase n=1 Tax=unclassified Marivita TaxID=2632480 RepID=UPI000D793A25|nr:peptide chain release factor N(5)-glutamine methyltransferase [Marivita sp. XM-24bin2]MCR9108690.1 peptide chain release factor N(5)-glutamine methyltransferase [Paracoccaceae bacterium]PWL34164.1 MAG: peptide chain release factor N(5)-glutamine methyltransferase [Marivita sp. XM-24bin2]
MTGTEALIRAIAQLREAGIDDPARDARRLLAHVLNIASGRLTLVLPDPIPEARVAAFDKLITRRLSREPVSHLIGTRAFYGRTFKVTPAVLDPRPETETLIQHALAADAGAILDLGTGSGCILLTLLAEQPRSRGWGTDLSAAALTVARENAEALGVRDRVTLGQGAWFDAVPPDTCFDLIVSNPPYIALDEMAALAPELRYEPRLALTDEADGLTAYRAITASAPSHLVTGGRLMVEIGPAQGEEVSALFHAAGFTDITVLTDLDGRDRVVSGVILPQSDS